MNYSKIQLKKNSNTKNTENITEPVVNKYFTSINNQEFKKTANLFTKTGKLLAPFEKPIVGRKAIASYLTQEAQEMTLLPHQERCYFSEDYFKKIQVMGIVKTSLFTVNVAWFFSLNPNQQITTAKVKLLASPQELLNLREIKN